MHEHGVTVNTSGKGPLIETGGQGKSGAASVKAAFAACAPSLRDAPSAPAGAGKPPAPPAGTGAPSPQAPITGAPPAVGGSGGEAAGGG
jgi:hypothetical protein